MMICLVSEAKLFSKDAREARLEALILVASDESYNEGDTSLRCVSLHLAMIGRPGPTLTIEGCAMKRPESA